MSDVGGVHDGIGRFDVAACGQAVAERGVVGAGHLGFVDDEVLVRRSGFRLRGGLAIERQAAPAFGVHHIGVVVRVEIVGDLERTARGRRIGAGVVEVAVIQQPAFVGTEQGDVHARAGGDAYGRVGHRGVQWFRMRHPRHDVLLAPKIVGAKPFPQREGVGQLLAGVRDGFHVDDGHAGVLGKALDHAVLAINRPIFKHGERPHGDGVAIR